MITSRQKQLLAIVVQEYTDTALPVSSRILVKKYKIPFSPATLRAELARLCDSGYLIQPHTSAGRIPTDKGYRFYIKNLMKPRGLSREEQTRIKKSLVKEKPSRGKVIAKTISLNSNNVGLYIDSDEEMVYKEGLSDLFQSPDFHERDDVLEMIRLLDDLDRHMETLFEMVERMWRNEESPRILIGRNSVLPLEDRYSILYSGYESGGKEILIGMIGPKRMDYARNISILNFIGEELISD